MMNLKLTIEMRRETRISTPSYLAVDNIEIFKIEGDQKNIIK